MKSPGELLECLGLAELCTLLNEGVLEVGPALQYLHILAVNVGRGVVLRGDQLVGKGLQRLDLLLLVADGLVKVLVLLDHHLNLLIVKLHTAGNPGLLQVLTGSYNQLFLKIQLTYPRTLGKTERS